MIKYYPKQIKISEERITGLEKDIQTVNQYPKTDGKFNPMVIDNTTYTDKEKAGTAIIERCKAMTSADPVYIGEYRGFKMILSFDTFSKEHKLNLQGALSYSISLGTDAFGNIQRIDNGLESMQKRLEESKSALEETRTQFETAKAESKKEFPQEEELNEKLKRLSALDALLNMDKKDSQAIDISAPDEDMPKVKSREMER